MRHFFSISFLCGFIGLVISCNNDLKQTDITKVDTTSLTDTLQKKETDTTKIIYLTFDDGPLNGTEGILAALDKEQIPATMFMVGRQVQLDTQMKNKFTRAYNDNLLEVGNHSFSHANSHYEIYYKDPQKVLDDFNKNQQLLQFKDKDARLPGRNTWRIGDRKKDDISANGSTAADLLHKNGYNLFGWDLEWQHTAGGKPVQTVQQMFAEIEKRISDSQKCFTPNHFVLLSHDEMFRTPWEVSELKQLVDLLKAKGYQFDHTDNYPGK